MEMKKIIFSVSEKLKLLPHLKKSLAELMQYCNVKDCKCGLCKLFSTSNRAQVNKKPKKTAFGRKTKMKKVGRNATNSRNVAKPVSCDKNYVLAKLKRKVALNKTGEHRRYTDIECRIMTDEYMKRGRVKAGQHFGMNANSFTTLICKWRKQKGSNYVPLKIKKPVRSIGEKKAIINYCKKHGYENGLKHFKFKNLHSIQQAIFKYKQQLKKQR